MAPIAVFLLSALSVSALQNSLPLTTEVRETNISIQNSAKPSLRKSTSSHLALHGEKIECGNGLSCLRSQTCATKKSGTGHSFACAPVPAATICTHTHFSCPSNFRCDLKHERCVHGNITTPLLTNTHAEWSDAESHPLAPHPDKNGGTVTRKNKNTNAAHLTSEVAGDNGVCELVEPELSSLCTCQDTTMGASLSCTYEIADNTITFTAAMDLCAKPADVSIEIGLDGEDWNKNVEAGDSIREETPLSIGTWGANIGIYAVAEFSANAAVVELKLGMDGCADVLGYEECGSDITSYLPINFIDEDISLSGVCDESNY